MFTGVGEKGAHRRGRRDKKRRESEESEIRERVRIEERERIRSEIASRSESREYSDFMTFKKEGFNEMASDIGKKRKISEWDVSEIEETDMACMHGVPVVVSPLKKSRKNASLWRTD